MKKHRGLSAVVGSVFLVAVVISSLSYVTYSMNLLGNFSESLIVEEKRQKDKQNEAFELQSVERDVAGKLDGIISNSGDIPLEIKSIYIEEDGVLETSKKFDINTTISPGNQADLGSLIDFDLDQTKGYKFKIISTRGTVETFYINSVGDNKLYLATNVYPQTISTNFDATIVMTVVNNSTDGAPLVNLTPITNLVVDTSNCTPDCNAIKISGPTPASYPMLKSGESVNFSWVYKVSGEDSDKITFETSLVNGVSENKVVTEVTVKEVESSLESGTALTSLGLSSNTGQSGVLFLHDETFDTPTNLAGPTYQMATTTPEIGGDYIDLSTNVPNFFLQNSSDTTIIPAGKWEASLRLLHEHMPDSLAESNPNDDDQVDVIYHFDSDTDPEPDSSGHNNHLEICGSVVGSITREESETATGNPTATAVFDSTPVQGNLLIAIAITRTGNSDTTNAAINNQYVNVDSTTSDGWTKIIQDYRYGDTNQRRGLAMWYKIADASEPTSVSARWDNGAGQTNLMIFEYSVNENNVFVYDTSASANSGNSDVDKQVTGTTATSASNNSFIVMAGMTRDTTSFSDWSDLPQNNLHYDVNSMVLDSGWRQDSNSSTKSDEIDWSGTDRKSTAAIAVFTLSTSGTQSPTYQNSGGPDDSPYYSFNGAQSQCFVSVNSANNQYMDVDREDNTTAMWVMANNLAVGTRSTMFYLEEGVSGSANDYYRIAFGDGTVGNEGKIVFDFRTDTNDVAKCISSSDYDDGTWHHIIAVRNTDRSCKLYIDGNTTPFTGSFSGGNNDIDVKDGNEPLRIGFDGTGDYFTGGIDQIFHWNDRGLGESGNTYEITDLYNARYGTSASIVDFSIYLTEQDGTNIEPPIATAIGQIVPFQDGGSIPQSSNDFAIDGLWGHWNFTNNGMPETIISVDQRLNFTINYRSGLDTYLRIDDNSMLGPLPEDMSSFLQVSPPTPLFASYYKYDNDEILQIIAFNSGPEGSWFQYQGTRAVFKNLDFPDGTSYSGLICSVNSTNTNILHSQGTNKCEVGGANAGYMLDEDRDSIFIPIDNIANLYFWQIQDRPDQNDSGGTVIPTGKYHLYVFINGYDETGKSFLRQIDVGRVDVTD